MFNLLRKLILTILISTPHLGYAANNGENNLITPAAVTPTAITTNTMIHDLSPWGMYQAADIVVKAVMIALLLASILCWSIWLYKWLKIRRAKSIAIDVIAKLKSQHELSSITSSSPTSGAELLIVISLQELALSKHLEDSENNVKERIAAQLERVANNLTDDASHGTGVLASIGSVAPFVGLFGTVWGIMNSFIGIAKSQTTNLAVVAPGIAEALLATALGLVAAIPAVLIYNYFSRSVAQYRAQLSDAMTAIMVQISRHLDEQKKRQR
ncbi:tonB-system energizer ExbB [Pseudoalteromonas prydzensis]|uniref:Biopolymer transport protein ExbB n=1 Tax=Pseudoalteromonas prydzensis TaxID=182141 RepID=A0ABR9FKF6_9GAMM|nr:tonB-system energizer ExbB [Pseudoalteromonas prydzensis]MBE0457294.1 tonB-system energizer ExbB [Pseudoalteromonas prydzensis]